MQTLNVTQAFRSREPHYYNTEPTRMICNARPERFTYLEIPLQEEFFIRVLR